MNYTFKERTVKCCTVGQAINVAQIRLGGQAVCTTSLWVHGVRRDNDEKITLVELNQIADRLVDDSHYYGA